MLDQNDIFILEKLFDRKFEQNFQEFGEKLEVTLEQKLDVKLVHLEERLEIRLEKRLTEKLDEKMRIRLNDFGNFIEDKMQGMISASENRLIARMDKMEERINANIVSFATVSILPQIDNLYGEVHHIKQHLKLA